MSKSVRHTITPPVRASAVSGRSLRRPERTAMVAARLPRPVRCTRRRSAGRRRAALGPVTPSESTRLGHRRTARARTGRPRPVARAGELGARATVRAIGAESCTADSAGGRDLLADAARGLGRAIGPTDAADRYAAAHLPRCGPRRRCSRRRARPGARPPGECLGVDRQGGTRVLRVGGVLRGRLAKRQAAEAGLHRLVSPREADDMVRQVAAFLDLVDDGPVRGHAGGQPADVRVVSDEPSDGPIASADPAGHRSSGRPRGHRGRPLVNRHAGALRLLHRRTVG